MKVQSTAAGRNDSQSKVQIADYGGICKVTGPSTLGISGCTSTEVVQGGALLGPRSNFASCIMKKYCGRQILQNLLRVFRRFFAWWTCATRTESAAGRPSQPMRADGTGRDPIANFGCPPLSPWNPIKRRPVRILLVRNCGELDRRSGDKACGVGEANQLQVWKPTKVPKNDEISSSNPREGSGR